MSELRLDTLSEYLSAVYRADVEVRYVGELGKRRVKPTKPRMKLKEFGYGVPYEIEFIVEGKLKHVILETMRPGGFGHEHFSDRAGILLWQHSAFNSLPRHARSVDVGAFTEDGSLKSLGDCEEFFIISDRVKGQPYFRDLDGIRERKRLTKLDRQRCLALSDYLAEIHSVKSDEAGLYVRRVRDLVGHGECIMGLCDSYPFGLEYISEEDLCEIEKRCVDWRWKLKKKAYRLAQVHGDYHPWNILFRRGTDFSVLDRSRGEWGEAADDLSAMSINYLFYSLRTYGELKGPFE
ncbi:MAG: phosphotransferase family protein, partial [Candidatus Bathyarchaeia archaeon]